MDTMLLVGDCNMFDVDFAAYEFKCIFCTVCKARGEGTNLSVSYVLSFGVLVFYILNGSSAFRPQSKSAAKGMGGKGLALMHSSIFRN